MQIPNNRCHYPLFLASVLNIYKDTDGRMLFGRNITESTCHAFFLSWQIFFLKSWMTLTHNFNIKVRPGKNTGILDPAEHLQIRPV